MKNAYLLFLHFLYRIIEVFVNLLNSKPKLINIKLKLGILILLLKGNDTNAQLFSRRVTCYRIGPRYVKNFDLFVQDRFAFNDFGNNTLRINLGYQKPMVSVGVSTSYHFNDNSIGVGPYMRLFVFERRRLFKQFVAVNYQFNSSSSLGNEFNASAGFNFFHQKKINFEIAYEYTLYNDDERTHYFMPVVGVHYYFRDRRVWRFHQRNRNIDNEQ